MTPTADTLSALLALPIEARRYLAERSTGPGLIGWESMIPIDRDTGERAGPGVWHWVIGGPRRIEADDLWLPCDPCEIVRLAVAVRGGEVYSAEIVATCPSTAAIFVAEGPDLRAEGPTPHAAALALFGAVWAERGAP